MKKLCVTLKAFTILEMLAGMAIAALVVLLGFYGLQLVQRQYGLFQKTTDFAQDYRHWEALLWNDFTDARWVEKQNDTLLLFTRDNFQISYRFSSNYVLRSVQMLDNVFEDTLQVKASIQACMLEGKQADRGLIDYCNFAISPFGESYNYPVIKIYSAQERMSYEKK